MTPDQPQLFYEDISDALRAVVQALGGHKPVGAKLWPEKVPDAAGRLLSDCLNAAKPEKLSPDQVLLLIKWGRECGCHAAMNFLAGETGYQATPITVEAERDRLADAISEAARTLERAMKVAERLPHIKAA